MYLLKTMYYSWSYSKFFRAGQAEWLNWIDVTVRLNEKIVRFSSLIYSFVQANFKVTKYCGRKISYTSSLLYSKRNIFQNNGLSKKIEGKVISWMDALGKKYTTDEKNNAAFKRFKV